MTDQSSGDAYLYAVLSLQESQKIRCQREGCGHSVYAAIFVVRSAGKFTLLGRECFKSLYGHEWSLGRPKFMPYYTPTGGGRRLTEQERKQLLENTEAFIDLLEREFKDRQERERLRQETIAKQREENEKSSQAMRERFAMMKAKLAAQGGFHKPPVSQLWANDRDLGSTFFCHELQDGTKWVLYLSYLQQYRYRPWPNLFDGWDEAWPRSIGYVVAGEPFYRVPDLAAFLRYLKPQIVRSRDAWTESDIGRLLGL